MTGASSLGPNKAVIYKKMLACVKAFQFEAAFKICKQHHMKPTVSDMDEIINIFVLQRESGIKPHHTLDRRLKALRQIRDHCDPEKIIEKIILPEGYKGKILIVAILGGIIDHLNCMRSGDLWHREILRNTENELRDLGFFNSSAYELGGAHVRFEADNDIIIFGTSDEFGSCDKLYASSLIQQVFKNKNIMIFD